MTRRTETESTHAPYGGGETGSPYAPHDEAETETMLDAIAVEPDSVGDVDSEEELFDIPDAVRFDGEFGIESRTEREVRAEVADALADNDDLVELLGRGHYAYYVPSVVDHLADRSEFLTSYTQYQPEVTQGFLQALFEYQSLLVELTGLGIANCSMYDAATALGEAATLAERVRETTGTRVLVPEHVADGRREVLANYVAGTDLVVETYAMDDGVADVDALADRADDETVMVYAETPTVRGCVEESLDDIGAIADERDALFVLGSDPISLSLLEEPSEVGADVVVGSAGALGLPQSFGMDLGLFACREDFVRQVPGRLVGASTDADGTRTYTLTLQTREQHIRRERATSNICTNQAWVALRASMHATALGADGLADLAKRDVARARDLAARVDDVTGVQAPVHDRHHVREFVAHTDQPAKAVRDDLADEGYAVHVVGDHHIQVCTTGATDDELDGFVDALTEVAR